MRQTLTNVRHTVLISTLLVLMSLTLLLRASGAEAASSSVSAQDSSVEIGSTVSVPLMLSDAPNGIAGFDIMVSMNNSSIVEITGADLPDYGLTSYEQISKAKVHLRAVDLNGLIEPDALNITLATLNILGLAAGTTDIQITVNTLDDDLGFAVPVQVFNGAITVLGDEEPVFSTNSLYVWDIQVQSRSRGKNNSVKDARLAVVVRQDADADGLAEGSDLPGKGAAVSLEFRDSANKLVASLSGTTNGEGIVRSEFIKNLKSGTYMVEVISLSKANMVWNQALDPTANDTDMDGDNLPDQVLIIQ